MSKCSEQKGLFRVLLVPDPSPAVELSLGWSRAVCGRAQGTGHPEDGIPRGAQYVLIKMARRTEGQDVREAPQMLVHPKPKLEETSGNPRTGLGAFSPPLAPKVWSCKVSPAQQEQ